MESKKTQFYFLVTLLVGALILCFFIMKPFLYAFILGVIFAVVFQPIQKRMLLLTRGRNGFAAFLTMLIVVVFVLTPMTFLGIQIFQEAQTLYVHLSQGEFTSIIDRAFPSLQAFSVDADQFLRSGLELVLKNLGNIFSSVIRVIADLFIFLLVLYYVLKDGSKLRKTVINMSPLSNMDDEAISKNLGLAINSVIKGNLLISCIQGVLVALGFTIFGVPQAVLWGTVAAIAALIPSIGTAIIVIPGVIYLFILGQLPAAIGLAVWGMVAVGLVDNILGPKFVSNGLKMHPLLVLISVIGGITFFGPTGFLLGPLTLSLVFALVKIYSSSFPNKVL